MSGVGTALSEPNPITAIFLSAALSNRQTERERDKTESQTGRRTDRQTGTQADRQTAWQPGSQADR